MPWGAAIAAGGSLIGGALSAGAAGSAAQTQANAANAATGVQAAEFSQIQNNLAPFLSGGRSGSVALADLLGISTGPDGSFQFNPSAPLLQDPIARAGGAPPSLAGMPQYAEPPFTQAMFQQSPGYQYQLQQIIDATQNAGSVKGGAVSGNALKALQANAGGLANQDWWNAYNKYDQNYQNQFNAANQGFQFGYNALNNNYWNNVNSAGNTQSNIFNRLSGLANAGQSAGANLGTAGVATAGQIGGNLIGAGNAGAAGQIGAANAIGGGLNSFATNLLASNTMGGAGGGNNSLLAYLLNQGGGAGGGVGDFSGGGSTF